MKRKSDTKIENSWRNVSVRPLESASKFWAHKSIPDESTKLDKLKEELSSDLYYYVLQHTYYFFLCTPIATHFITEFIISIEIKKNEIDYSRFLLLLLLMAFHWFTRIKINKEIPSLGNSKRPQNTLRGRP